MVFIYLICDVTETTKYRPTLFCRPILLVSNFQEEFKINVCSPVFIQGTHHNLHCYFQLKGNTTSSAYWKYTGKIGGGR